MVASKAMVRKVSEQIMAVVEQESPFPETVEDFPLHLQPRASEAFDAFKTACRGVEQFIREEYSPVTREQCGCMGLPNGSAIYSLALRFHTTTTMTAEEIHQVGLSEVARIEERYRNDVLVPLGYMKEDTDDDKNFQEVFQKFVDTARGDQTQVFDTTEELLQGYRDLCSEISTVLPKYFSTIPKSPLDFVAKNASSAPAAYYMAGTPDGSRPGRFYVNVSNLSQRPKYEMTSLALHEAIPGHHHQCALALENPQIPDFLRYLEDRRYEFCPARRQLYAAYLEGWALYCEALGEEMGMYKDDPMKIFGRLSMEAMRAVRLVVDTGIHHKGWAVEQAIEYMMEKTGMHRHECEVLYYTIIIYVLYYTISYYIILYYTILYYTILYYIILYYTILYHIILYHYIHSALYYIILSYPIL